LACGAELKNTFCLARDNYAFVSHHIGDLENLETLSSYREGIEHFKRVFYIEPSIVAYDLHPEYLSTKYALSLDDTPIKIAVQHHHAHIASCMVDNHIDGEVIGVAMDGLGFGTDGRMWGGEFFVADFVEAERETLLLEANAPAQVLAAFQAHAAERKALLFTPTVATAYAMAATFCAAGIAAEALDATTPLATRRAILQRLHTGATRVVANCAVLTEGFDEPSLDCIIVARPTQSLSLYQQMLGRGTRTYPGKTDCLLLDVVGVSTRHTLHTVATLFGCAPAALARQSVLEVLAARERQARQPAEGVAGTLRSTPVDLFARRTLRWVQTRQGAWVLSLGAQHGTVRLRPDGPETWQVVQVRRDTDPLRLGDTLPLPYAQGLAEDYARHLGVARLVEAEAPWRQQPATEKQTALLRKLGMTARAGLTKGEAADLLAAVLGDWG